jgi:hypothetical protein
MAPRALVEGVIELVAGAGEVALRHGVAVNSICSLIKITCRSYTRLGWR